MVNGTTAADGRAEPAGDGGDGGVTGGGRWVEVAPDRLGRWVASFGERHGTLAVEAGRLAVTSRAADGAAAECHPPFPPLPATAGGTWPDSPADLAGLIAAHATADRTVGVFLVRLGGFAAGVFAGSPPRLVSSKVGTRLVHGGSGARADPRLRPVMKRAVDRFLTVPDPRLAVLRDSPRLFLAVRIHLTGPA